MNSAQNILRRTAPIPKQTTLGFHERSLQQHLTSLEAVNVERRDQVILLDDVLTTGKSMQACFQILENAGANVLWGICFGKTAS